MSEKKTITIDGKEYVYQDLPEAAKNQLGNMNVVNQEIARLKQQLAVYQTARAAYADALNKALDEHQKP